MSTQDGWFGLVTDDEGLEVEVVKATVGEELKWILVINGSHEGTADTFEEGKAMAWEAIVECIIPGVDQIIWAMKAPAERS